VTVTVTAFVMSPAALVAVSVLVVVAACRSQKHDP
jgi:hypothetical protein